MHFEPGHLYHIYNQGNNKQKIFFSRENYLFFLKKLHHHLLPHCYVLAWCLMPNHFHLMVKVEQADSKPDYNKRVNSRTPSAEELNKAIGIILASYTRAINKQENHSGSLFRAKTKAICLTNNDAIANAWFVDCGINQISVDVPEVQYPNLCYRYILYNPVKAGLVKRINDWEFSSAPDVLGMRGGKLINREVIRDYNLLI